VVLGPSRYPHDLSGPQRAVRQGRPDGAPAATQVADRFHLVQNLRETIERELAVRRAHLRVGGADPLVPASCPTMPVIEPTVTVPVTARERLLWPARRLALDTEIARQRRQETQDLFDRFKGLQATKLPMTVIAQQLGLNRRRFDRWAKVDTLPVLIHLRCSKTPPAYAAVTPAVTPIRIMCVMGEHMHPSI
jgi:transposase